MDVAWDWVLVERKNGAMGNGRIGTENALIMLLMHDRWEPQKNVAQGISQIIFFSIYVLVLLRWALRNVPSACCLFHCTCIYDRRFQLSKLRFANILSNNGFPIPSGSSSASAHICSPPPLSSIPCSSRRHGKTVSRRGCKLYPAAVSIDDLSSAGRRHRPQMYGA